MRTRQIRGRKDKEGERWIGGFLPLPWLSIGHVCLSIGGMEPNLGPSMQFMLQLRPIRAAAYPLAAHTRSYLLTLCPHLPTPAYTV